MSSLATTVAKLLEEAGADKSPAKTYTSAQLQRAEELADQYAHIQPKPYVVAAERYVGLPCRSEAKEGTF